MSALLASVGVALSGQESLGGPEEWQVRGVSRTEPTSHLRTLLPQVRARRAAGAERFEQPHHDLEHGCATYDIVE